MNIVAVCACATGVAHTYMAKKGLEDAAIALGFTIKVETQGALGIENRITPADIAAADAALLAVDVGIADAGRFAGIPSVTVPCHTAIKSPRALLQKLEAALAAGKAANTSAYMANGTPQQEATL